MRILTVALVALVAAGCAVTPPATTLPEITGPRELRWAALARYDQWRVTGRMAIKTPDDGFSASLSWRQNGPSLSARLHGPLGRGTVLLNGSPAAITIRDSKGDAEVLTDPEQALRRRYGWTVPIESFRFWVLGIADPRIDGKFDIDETGLLRSLDQGDWQVEYREYQAVGATQLPRKMVARSGAIKLTLVLKQWQIPYPVESSAQVLD